VVKVAPDLEESQIIEMGQVIRNSAIDGVSNTTVTRPSSLGNPNKSEIGGVPGNPLKPYSLQALRTFRVHLTSTIQLIGCGGISSGADALEYVHGGASRR